MKFLIFILNTYMYIVIILLKHNCLSRLHSTISWTCTCKVMCHMFFCVEIGCIFKECIILNMYLVYIEILWNQCNLSHQKYILLCINFIYQGEVFKNHWIVIPIHLSCTHTDCPKKNYNRTFGINNFQNY